MFNLWSFYIGAFIYLEIKSFFVENYFNAFKSIGITLQLSIIVYHWTASNNYILYVYLSNISDYVKMENKIDFGFSNIGIY